MNYLCALLFFFSCLPTICTGFEGIGINYGLNGDNLPSPSDVISLLKSRNISKIRVFEPNQSVLNALRGSGISVILGTRNEDLQPLATSLSFASTWIKTNVIPFVPSVDIKCISAGNEVEGDLAQNLPVAMQNLNSALLVAKLNIPVSTTVSMAVFTSTYPPSQGAFSAKAVAFMAPVTKFLELKGYPLIANIYPYFPIVSDQANIPLDYALLQDTAKTNPDGELVYRNLFDAMLDSVYAALEKAGGPNVKVVVGETGWPSGGGTLASTENAKIYNNNLVRHVESREGTPRRAGKQIEAYIFALFNENLKPNGVEQNWGLYSPNITEVYHVDF